VELKVGERARNPITMLSLAAVNFFLVVGYSQILSATDFGIASVFWLSFTLITSASRAIFSEQVLAQPSDAVRAGLLGVAVAMTCLFVTGAVIALASLGRLDLLAAVLPLALLNGSDPVRYVRMSRSGHLSWLALPGLDLARAGIAVTFWCLAVLDAPSAILVLAATSAGALGFLARWRSASLVGVVQYVRSRGRFEALMGAQFVVAIVIGQLLPILALAAFGPAAFGQLRLAQTYVSPANTVAGALQPTLIGSLSRASAQKASGLAKSMGLMIGVGLAALVGALTFAMLMSRAEISSSFQPLLVPVAISALAAILGQPGGALIRVRRQGGISFIGQVIGAVVGLIACVAAAAISLQAFAWGLTIYSSATVLSTYLLLLASSFRNRPGRRPNDGGTV
jgi:O-antigen/teichoic acid export membrane protein